MEPSHISKIIQQKAALVRTELLIQAHQRRLVQYIKQLYNVELYIMSLLPISEPQCVDSFTTYSYTGAVKYC